LVVLRNFSVPERLAGFGVAVAVAAVVWPVATSATGLGLPCPLRAITGVPCPVCGMTTAAVALVHGHPGVAFAANPAIFGLAALTVAVLPLIGLRAAGVLASPRPWSVARRRQLGWVMAFLAAVSWAFQLHRLGLIG
jgi:hypothetical protein